MYFKRKAYESLREWKAKYADRYAMLLEGARRVGKSTIAEAFAKNEYRSYILIDFSKTSDAVKACFGDISNLNLFFLRLQAETGVTLCKCNCLVLRRHDIPPMRSGYACPARNSLTGTLRSAKVPFNKEQTKDGEE